MVQRPPARLRALALALLVALALVVGGRQVGWKALYAPYGAYRAQVAALLDGQFALSDAPEAMQHDMAWTGTGVQQVWGLGVPAWEAPFEVAGRAIGVTPFPDRVALLAWLALVAYACVRAFVRRDEPWWVGAGTVVITALLPAFVTLMRGRFGVYEEAAAYAYGGAIVLLAGCARLADAPSRWRYFALVAAAGLAGFLRPTTWCYGLATFVVASALHRRARDIALGAALFVAGGAALYASNARRFGDGLEFGHAINLQHLPGNLYATRFSYPFQRVGVVEASEELAGALFDRPEKHVHTTFYGKHLHVGQSELPRWREYYFSTFNWAYPPLLVAGLVLGVLAWRRRDGPREPRWLAAWALIGGAPIAVFYLHAPFLSSRYLLDVAPAFAALIVVVWRAVARKRGAVFVLAAGWLASVALARTAPRLGPSAVDRDAAIDAAAVFTHAVAREHPLPESYDLDDPWLPMYTDVLESFDRCNDADGTAIDPDDVAVPGDTCLHGERATDEEQWRMWQTQVPDASEPELCEPRCTPDATAANSGDTIAAWVPPPCLYLNMSRWNLITGQVPPAAYAWVQDPDFIEIDLAEGDPSQVRVAIGRTHLHLTSLADLPHGVRLRFEAPHLPRGLQVAFFAFGPDTELDHATTPYFVHAIRWRTR